MAGTKRKAMVESVSPISKKLKTTPLASDKEDDSPDEEFASSDENERIDRPARFRYDPADDTEDEYEPEDDVSDAEADEEMPDVADDDLDLAPQPKRKTGDLTVRQAASKKAKVAKENLFAEQIEFVIHTRDNNKPDPFGTHSTTTGKLAHPKVAKLYNAKFGRRVGGAAVEKRYRNHLPEYLQAHPTYPQNIVYAPKPPAPKRAPRQRQKKDRNAPKASEVLKPSLKKVHSGNYEPQEIDLDDGPQVEKCPAPRNVYRAPDELREAADLFRYVEDKVPVDENEQPEYVFMVVKDSYDREVGKVALASRDLARTSRQYMEDRQFKVVEEYSTTAESKIPYARYAQCISMEPSPKLPEYDFALVRYRTEGGGVEYRPTCTPIDWDFKALVDLYTAAALLQDDRVRDCVLDHWREQFQGGGEIEIDRVDLNNLYAQMERNDPAGQFWAMILQDRGFAEQILSKDGWNPDLVDKLERMSQRVGAESPWQWGDNDFCRTFHCHFSHSDCHWDETDSGESEALPCFNAITHRLISALDSQSEKILADEDALARQFERLVLDYIHSS